MNDPASALQDALAELIAVAGAPGGVIGCAIAFDADQVPAGGFGIDHGEIDAVALGAHLGVNLIAVLTKSGADFLFERRFFAASGGEGDFDLAGLGEFEIALEGRDPEASAICAEIVGGEVAEDFAAAAGAGDENVQAALPTISKERAELLPDHTRGVSTVGHADHDDVALITLDVFEVLDDEGLVGMSVPEGDEGLRFGAFQLGDFVVNQVGLRLVHRGDHQAFGGVFFDVPQHRLGDQLGFFQVRTFCCTGFIDGIGMVVENHAHAAAALFHAGAGEDHQAVLIEHLVGGLDEGGVDAAVVPSQVGAARGAKGYRAHHAQDALQLARLLSHLGELVFGIFDFFVIVGHAVEEAGGRHLAGVSHDDGLIGADDGAQGVFRLDLRRLVEDHHVERREFGREMDGHAEGAHHENRFDALNRLSGAGHDPTDRLVATLEFALDLE